MTTHVEELRAELARAQAEGRELRAKLAIAEGERDGALAQTEELTRGLRSAQDESQQWRAAVRDAARKVSAAFHLIDRGFSGPAQDAAHEALDAAIDALRHALDAEAPRV